MHSTVASLPSLTSDERERLLADESLRSLFAVFASIALLTRVLNKASAMIYPIC